MSAKPVPNHQSHHFVQITTFFSLSLSPPPFSPPFIHKKPYTSVLLPQQPPASLHYSLLPCWWFFYSLFFFFFLFFFLTFVTFFSPSPSPSPFHCLLLQTPSNSFKLLQTSSNFFKFLQTLLLLAWFRKGLFFAAIRYDDRVPLRLHNPVLLWRLLQSGCRLQ